MAYHVTTSQDTSFFVGKFEESKNLRKKEPTQRTFTDSALLTREGTDESEVELRQREISWLLHYGPFLRYLVPATVISSCQANSSAL